MEQKEKKIYNNKWGMDVIGWPSEKKIYVILLNFTTLQN
jgi:hypothetical protein